MAAGRLHPCLLCRFCLAWSSRWGKLVFRHCKPSSHRIVGRSRVSRTTFFRRVDALWCSLQNLAHRRIIWLGACVKWIGYCQLFPSSPPGLCSIPVRCMAGSYPSQSRQSNSVNPVACLLGSWSICTGWWFSSANYKSRAANSPDLPRRDLVNPASSVCLWPLYNAPINPFQLRSANRCNIFMNSA